MAESIVGGRLLVAVCGECEVQSVPGPMACQQPGGAIAVARLTGGEDLAVPSVAHDVKPRSMWSRQ